MKKYIDLCKTLEILRQDSGLLPKPTETWKTFTPQLGDIAYVNADNSEYEFNGSDWIKKEISSRQMKKSNSNLEKIED